MSLRYPVYMLACCVSLAGHAARPDSPQPNIVFILTDDMGYSDIGCYGGRFAPTPNIDRLASEGVRFHAVLLRVADMLASRTRFHHGHVSGALADHELSWRTQGKPRLGAGGLLGSQSAVAGADVESCRLRDRALREMDMGGGAT